MNISTKDWSLTIDLNGGRITELTCQNTKVLGTYNRIDGKMGSSHLCIPSFDKEGQEIYGLPFHGLVRNGQWNMISGTPSALTIGYTTTASDLYGAELHVQQEFTLAERFCHKTTISHKKGAPVPVNCAYHYYWDTPLGWKGTQLNTVDVSEKISTNGYCNLEKENAIVFPHASYQVTRDRFHSAALWTSFMQKEKGKEFSTDFCCIEPVIGWPGYFGSEKSILSPGEAISASISIEKVV